MNSYIDCACVIHGSRYDWQYVDRLYSMLCKNLSAEVRMHVYTEHDRSVPAHMIKHALDDWGIAGPRKSWWYKMQLFNPAHVSGKLLYFDLDVVISNSLNWVIGHSTDYFWAIKDFKHLQNPDVLTLNSSMMWWDTNKFSWIWDKFSKVNLSTAIKKHHGDQDYLATVLNVNQCRFFDNSRVESYRWQCLDGGYDFAKRQHLAPDTGVKIQPTTSVVVFHGNPKPAEVQDPVIQQLWQ